MKPQIVPKFQLSVRKLTTDIFHYCNACGKHWKTKQEFLKDRQISLSNYKLMRSEDDSDFSNGGELVFVHKARSCGKFLKISANEFQNAIESHKLYKIR